MGEHRDDDEGRLQLAACRPINLYFRGGTYCDVHDVMQKAPECWLGGAECEVVKVQDIREPQFFTVAEIKALPIDSGARERELNQRRLAFHRGDEPR